MVRFSSIYASNLQGTHRRRPQDMGFQVYLILIFIPVLYPCYDDILFHKLGCSGDTDSVVPVTGTRYSIRSLKLPPVSKWYPWYDNEQVEEETKQNKKALILCFILFLLRD